MAIWSSDNILLTTKGREVLSKVQSGNGKLTITKVKTSSGRVSESQLHSLTAVSTAKQTMEIAKSTSSENGSNLELRVSNTDLTESYAINQIGVYASHPDTGEILYMIAQCDEGTADIMPLPSETPATLYYDLYLIHSATQEVEITVDPLGYISNATFDEHLTEFNNLKGSVTKNTQDISKNTQDISKNMQDISKNRQDISANTQNITKNTQDISANTQNITKNAQNISTNTGNIAKNTGNITKNTQSITKNTQDIGKNADNIASNSKRINVNTQNISSIRNDVQSLETKSETNRRNINTMSGAVINLMEDVDSINYYLGLDNDVYGVEVDFSKGVCSRIGASVNLIPKEFNDILPWGGRRRCILADDGTVLAYYGEEAYTETGYLEKEVEKEDYMSFIKTYPVGTPVQVMVEQPKFWYRLVPIETQEIPNQGTALVKARYYISTSAKPGFKVFPLFTRGNPLREVDKAYLAAYKGSIYDNREPQCANFKVTLTQILFDKEQTITVVLDRCKRNIFTLNKGDSLEIVAYKIRDLFFEDWELSGTGSSIVFECTKPGCRQRPEFYTEDNKSAFSLSVEGSYGYGGYVENNCNSILAISKESDLPLNLMLSSIAGVSPQYGNISSKVALTRSLVTKLCNNRNKDHITGESIFTEGFGWQQKDLSALCCTIWLHLIEYASFNCQNTIGLGLVDSSVDFYSKSYPNGATSFLGNSSGTSGGSDYTESYVSYRGEENLWGRITTWIEGLNYYANDNKAYFSVSGVYTEGVGTNKEGYKPLGFHFPDSSRSSGFISRFGYSEDFDWGFLAIEASGSSSGQPGDYFHLSVTPSILDTWYALSSQPSVSIGNNYPWGLCSYCMTKSTGACAGSLLFIPEP